MKTINKSSQLLNAKTALTVLAFIIITTMSSFASSSPLQLFYHDQLQDNYTTASLSGWKKARNDGYRHAGLQGHVLTKPQRGAKALKLYYHQIKKDYFLTATDQGVQLAREKGYTFLKNEGYVLENFGKNSRRLVTYYSEERNDFFTTATEKGKQNAINAGYVLIGLEGYVLINPIPKSGQSGTSNPPSFEDVPIWKLTLYVQTSYKDNAGTDDEVSVRFGDYNEGYSAYYLDKGGNDRERGDRDYYEIFDPKVKTIKDIKKLSLSLHILDGWNISEIKLFINNATIPIFEKFYKNGHWLDDKSGRSTTLTIPSEELRRHAKWRFLRSNESMRKAPKSLDISTLEKMVECHFGHSMNKDIKSSDDWEFGDKSGRAYVEGKYYQEDRLLFDLDLVDHLPDVYPGVKHLSREMDVDFFLIFEWKNNQVNITHAFKTQYVGGPGGFNKRKRQARFINDFTKELENRVNTIVRMGNYQNVKLSKSGHILFS